MEIEKYVNEEGKIGVIVSPGYGAGWSSWVSDETKPRAWFAMDKTLVEFKLNGADIEAVKKYIKESGVDYCYMGGWEEAIVQWVSKGTSFLIDEYDGNETLEYADEVEYMVA